MAGVGAHFFLLVLVSCRDVLLLHRRGLTSLPAWFREGAQTGENIATALLGQTLSQSSPVRRAIATYLHSAGIETGYGYFAPNVPDGHRLVFELHLADGRIEQDLPGVYSPSAAMRLCGLLDRIAHERERALRERLVKVLAASSWREHPDAILIRAMCVSVMYPSADSFAGGAIPTNEFLFAYDFRIKEKPPRIE